MGYPETALPQTVNYDQPAPHYSQEQLVSPPPYTAVEACPLARATKFTPILNGYIKWATFHLGPSADEKHWVVDVRSGGFSGKKPTIVLHDGPTAQHAVLATAACENSLQTRYVIRLPGRAGPDGENLAVRMGAPTIKRSRCKLSIPVGQKGGVEDFEWRSSSGEEVKTAAKGASWGWKLVRLQGPNSKPGGSSTAESGPGFSSDRREVVAVIALSATMSRNKMIRFNFIGSGATGAMGETFEVVAVTSALQLWQVFYAVGAI